MRPCHSCLARVQYRHIFWFLIGAIIIVIIGRELYQSTHAIDCNKCRYNEANRREYNQTYYCTNYSGILNPDGDEDCCYVPLRRFTNPFVRATVTDSMNNQLANLIMMYFQINTGHIVSIKGTDGTDMRGGSQQESMLVTNSAMVVYFGNYIDSVNEMSSFSAPSVAVEFCSLSEAPKSPVMTDEPTNLMPSRTLDVMKVMIAGLCGGLLLLVLVMFVFTRFIYPNYVRNNQNSRSRRTDNRTAEPVTVSSQIDLPPTYSDIGNYAKIDGEEQAQGPSPPAYPSAPPPPPPAYNNAAYNN